MTSINHNYQKLASLLVNYSVAVKKGDKVLIDVGDVPDEWIIALVRAVKKAGGLAFVSIKHSAVSREIILKSDQAQVLVQRDYELFQMKKMDCYIAVRGSFNINELSDVPSNKLQLYSKILRPVIDQRVNKTRWVILRWPTPSMAQSAGMSTESFTKLFFDVCTFDYRKMAHAMLPLQKRMQRANQVVIKGNGTDLKFSIKGIGAIMCQGLRNIPDGEVFSCPIKDSVEGVIQYNVPTIYQGTRFENVRLVFSKGKIIQATSNNSKRLNQILDTDSGARYIGEFSLGFNPYIMEPLCDILFDEKIAGSLHFTPGQAYEDCDNGNRSAVHWDMVLIQRKEYGGGSLWFDNELIRKDGLFIPKDLKALNWQNLRVRR
jgi:aminopeptidase